MNNRLKTREELLIELEETQRQLIEAEEAIEAIRTGQVDALIVQKGDHHQLYTLESADLAYRIFIEKMNEGAVTLNRLGIILYANSQFAAMVDRSLSQVIGMPFQDFIAPPSQEFYSNLFEAGWKGDCKGEVDISYNQQVVSTQLSLNSMLLSDEISMSIIITDLTLQKAIQKILEDNNRQLAHLNKTLEASNHDLLQFASVASHDLQEPLRKIQMFGNLLKLAGQIKPASKEERYLEKMITSAERMKTLIVDILNYSRLSSHHGEFLPVNLLELIEEILEDFELVIQEKKAEIIVSDLPILEVNRGQIRQALQNLISNALKFSKPDLPPKISITGRPLDRKEFDAAMQTDRSFYLICVEDNGIGFEEKYIPNIFALFERLNSKEKYEGTGIGLAITKKIVEKHHGVINVKSTIGEGSIFQIILPVKQV